MQKRNFDELKGAIDKAHVVYHPERLRISIKTLLSINAYNRKFRKFNTIFDQVGWTSKQLKEIKVISDYLGG
ncbi:hypothetical protein [Virgibacillus oceani]|uniref:hypothetical protein n=1 Tax=Virgibacillus oceani TaxID=1479511 RepID=UPI00166A18B9|nr:hypothetical protein [Virgibacillus oceani]